MPHFKVLTSSKNHAKMAAVYQSNELLAFWVRLGVEAIERFADRTDDVFLVSDRELCSLSGKHRADVARTWLERLADVSPISAERQGDVWRITFPNFAKKQGFAQKNVPQSGTPATATSTATSKPPKSPPLKASKPKPEPKYPGYPAGEFHPCPEVLPDAALGPVVGRLQQLAFKNLGDPLAAARAAVAIMHHKSLAGNTDYQRKKRSVDGWVSYVRNSVGRHKSPDQPWGSLLDEYRQQRASEERERVLELESASGNGDPATVPTDLLAAMGSKVQ